MTHFLVEIDEETKCSIRKKKESKKEKMENQTNKQTKNQTIKKKIIQTKWRTPEKE